jgi:hypothetical protein
MLTQKNLDYLIEIINHEHKPNTRVMGKYFEIIEHLLLSHEIIISIELG